MEGRIEERQRRITTKEKFLRVMDMFITLIMVMVSQVYTKLIKLYLLNMCSLLFAYHTSVKLFLKRTVESIGKI